jgi:hypothetical protein
MLFHEDWRRISLEATWRVPSPRHASMASLALRQTRGRSPVIVKKALQLLPPDGAPHEIHALSQTGTLW